MPNDPTVRPGDCKSSIHRFDSDPRLHFFPSLSEENVDGNRKKVEKLLFCGKNFINKSDCIIYSCIDTEVRINDHGKYVTLKFSYKNNNYSQRLNTTLAQLRGSDIESVVERTIREADGDVSLKELLEYYLENGTGSLSTRKKNVAHIKDLLKRDNLSLEESVKFLANTDELGRTLPERWEEIYRLPHKLRQIRSIFGRKNLALYKRQGWDTKVFGNFVVFAPETTVSQPFSTSDVEVDHIINTFQNARADHPVFYDIYLLAFGCGLRKSEIYQVQYEHFTTFNGQHFLMLPFATKRTKIKQLNGVTEKVGISQQVFDHFTERKNIGEVINGGDRLHKRFVKFLKSNCGITETKACHRLRKILGARLATTAGIFHASKTLRNSVAVCERYYSDLTQHANELQV